MTFTPLEQAEIRRSLASYLPPSRRARSGPLLAGFTVLTAVVALGFGALAWLDRPEQTRAPAVAGDTQARAALEQRNQELVAMRAAHQEEIARLERRITEIEGGDEAGPEEGLAQLASKLEEVRAESYELEVEASLLEEPNHARRHASRRGSPGEAEGAGAGGSGGEIDENPYDGVTSATNLNNTVWARDAASARPSKAAASPAGSVDELIESAIKGPDASGSGGPAVEGQRSNTLPTSGQAELPARPPRRAVKQVLGSMLGAVRRCGGEPYERLVVELTVTGATGRVSRARTVDATHAGTPIGACAAKAVGLARFPRFAKDEVVIKYPFEL